jgi:hypothetical protein
MPPHLLELHTYLYFAQTSDIERTKSVKQTKNSEHLATLQSMPDSIVSKVTRFSPVERLFAYNVHFFLKIKESAKNFGPLFPREKLHVY